MKERPILFSAPMVRAILAGTKTQTRRAVKPVGNDEAIVMLDHGKGWCPYRSNDGEGSFHTVKRGGEYYLEQTPVECPYGKPGDRLWVRETWRIGAWNENDGTLCIDYRDGPRKEWIDIPEIADPDGDVFRRYWEQSSDDAERAGLKCDEEGKYTWEPGQSPCRWRPSIHMPRWASRITLEIVNVRVERLQDISEADAISEGITTIWPDGPRADGGPNHYTIKVDYCSYNAPTATGVYAMLWDVINGPGSWAANPWVWVVEFRRVDRAATV